MIDSDNCSLEDSWPIHRAKAVISARSVSLVVLLRGLGYIDHILREKSLRKYKALASNSQLIAFPDVTGYQQFKMLNKRYVKNSKLCELCIYEEGTYVIYSFVDTMLAEIIWSTEKTRCIVFRLFAVCLFLGVADRGCCRKHIVQCLLTCYRPYFTLQLAITWPVYTSLTGTKSSFSRRFSSRITSY